MDKTSIKRNCAATIISMVNAYSLVPEKIRPSFLLAHPYFKEDYDPNEAYIISYEFLSLLAQWGISNSLIMQKIWNVWTDRDLLTLISNYEFLGYNKESYVEMVVNEGFDFAERMKELCSLWDINLTPEEFNVEVMKYSALQMAGVVIEQLKYSTNLAFCKHFNLERPEVKAGYLGDRLFPRRLRVKLQVRIGKTDIKSMTMVNTIFQGFKKGLLPVRPEQVSATMRKHADTLSQSHTTPASALEVVQRVAETIIDKQYGVSESRDRDAFLSMTDLEYMEEFGIDAVSYDSPRPLFTNVLRSSDSISNRSTLEYPYGQGSLRGLLDRYYRRSYGDVINLSDEFIGFLAKGRELVEIRVFGPANDELLSELTPEILALCKDLTPKVTPYCILEPMKVRTITKANWYQYPALKRSQKILWRKLKDMKEFSLIGGYEDLSSRLIPLMDASLKDSSLGFVSGDYSAATDNLHQDVTLTLANTLIEGMPVDFQSAFVNALCGSEISYSSKCLPRGEGLYDKYNEFVKKNDNGKGTIFSLPQESIIQRNGQLMGSILSFPLLCLANYACYHYAVEKFSGVSYAPFRLPGHYRNVLINGDDILFSANPDFYDCWLSCLPLFGFQPSVGKNLYSRNLIQINSVLYRVEFFHKFESKDFFTYERIPYVNFGLITNRKKQDCSRDTSILGVNSCSEDNLDELHGRIKVLPKIQRTLLDGFDSVRNKITDRVRLPTFVERIQQLFWKHSKYLRRYFPKCLPFLPESIGGMGLIPIKEELDKDLDIWKSDGCPIRKPFLSVVYKVGTLDFVDGKKFSDRDIRLAREFFGAEFPVLRLIPNEYTPFLKYKEWRTSSLREIELAEKVLDWQRPAKFPTNVLVWGRRAVDVAQWGEC
jgi:hypothetical protein